MLGATHGPQYLDVVPGAGIKMYNRQQTVEWSSLVSSRNKMRKIKIQRMWVNVGNLQIVFPPQYVHVL